MESTLSLSLNDLAGDVGDFLGYGRGSDNGDLAWTDQQARDVSSCLKSGLRQFYFPTPLPGEHSSYDWSFTKPIGLIRLLQNEQTVALPDDFGGAESYITVSPTNVTETPWIVQLMGEGTLRQAFSLTPTRTGKPIMAAVIPLKPTSQQGGQRFQLNVYPIADQDYTLQIPYYINPNALTADNPYPLGGLQHSETIREACLMAAENFKDDASTIHAYKFMERLAASVNSDRRLKPQLTGYNADRSDSRECWDRPNLHGTNWSGIRYNGVQY